MGLPPRPRAAAATAAPGGGADDAPVFDERVLLGLLGGDRAAVAEILGEYAADAPRQLAALREALLAGDPQLVQRHAHTLKGASANVGAETVRRAAHRLELAAGAGRLDDGAELVTDIETELERFREAVRAAGAAS